LFPSERVTVEPIEISYERTLVQKLFRFFYSYLLYTNTTKILATMGMRPDEPPAGGNRFLAPVKWLLANTFGRSIFIRKKLAPWLYFKINPERPFAEAFEKYQPDVVFLSSIYDRFDSRLIPEAKRRSVKTIAMQASWDHIDKYYMPFQADIFIAHSEQIRRAAIKFQSYKPESAVTRTLIILRVRNRLSPGRKFWRSLGFRMTLVIFFTSPAVPIAPMSRISLTLCLSGFRKINSARIFT